GDAAGERGLALELGRALIEAEYMGGDPDVGAALVRDLLVGSADALERAALIDLKIGLDIFHGRHVAAIASGIDGLAGLGVALAADPQEGDVRVTLARVDALLAGRSVAELAALPDADDPRAIAAMQLLMVLGPAAMFVHGRLAFAIFLAIVEGSLTHGITRASSYGFAGCGMAIACSLDRHADGGALGEVALRLVDRVGDRSLTARTYQLVGGLLLPWTRPFAQCIELLDRGYRLGIATGDLASACYNATSLVLLENARGRSVADLCRVSESMLRESGEIFAVHGSSVLQMSLRVHACLVGERPEPTPASAERWFAEVWDAEVDPQATALSLLYDNIYSTLILLVFGCPEGARRLPPQAAERLRAFATPMSVDALYLHALCRCRSGDALAPEARPEVESALARLAIWSAACPENFAARHALLSAELARVDGRRGDAELAYKAAITAARRSGELLTEALACEFAGRLAAAQDDPVLADMYMRTAMEAYARWGAAAKSAALVRELGLASRRAADVDPASTPLLAGLDLASLIKASRAISSEIQLDRVLRTLLEVVMENAGASRGLVVLEVLEGHGRLEVVAEGSVDPPEIRVLEATPLADHPAIARSVVEFVCRGHRDVLLARADREGDFRGDPYLAGGRVKSVVCTPILHQGRCTGALYLEHARAEGVFTAARLELLRQLAAQLAVSIENARLYDDLSRARSEAIAAERVKARFLMNMSHELRTPLNAVIGYAELMQENLAVGAIDTFADDLDRIHRAARSLLRTLSGILELSKLAGGGAFVERAAVDLDALIGEVVGELAETAAAAGDQLEVVGDPVGAVVTDRSMVRYCLHCLIDNACKFTQRGRVTVTRARERGAVVVQVRDTGIGIPGSALQSIFGAFTQVDPSASRAHEGAGVGLTVARHFARLIGGDLTAESTLGEGSTFVLTIPGSPAS
ncbi:MAG: ATP-binding protein, partial [Nannocystaceae bacterium]